MNELARAKLSVAIAAYKGEQFIESQLRSIEEQTVRPDEIVIVDDASGPDTLDRLEKIVESTSIDTVLITNGKNIGYTKSFEKAISNSNGDYVFLCDQDDYWYANKVELMMNAAENSPERCVFIHDIEYADKNLVGTGETKLQRLRKISSKNTRTKALDGYSTGMATMVSKSFANLCMPIPKLDQYELPHDIWIHSCAQSVGLRELIPDVLASFRRHESNVTKGSIQNSRETNWKARLRWYRKRMSDTVLNKSGSAIARKEVLLSWLDENRNRLIQDFGVSAGTIDEAKRRILREIRANRQRLRIAEAPWYEQKFRIIAFGLVGSYRHFNGMRSFIRDLFLGF